MIDMSRSQDQDEVIDQLKRDKKLPEQDPQHDYLEHSLWSNLCYGLIMLVIIILPPLIPGISTQVLITSYISFVVAVYTAVFIIKLFSVLRDRTSPLQRRFRP